MSKIEKIEKVLLFVSKPVFFINIMFGIYFLTGMKWITLISYFLILYITLSAIITQVKKWDNFEEKEEKISNLEIVRKAYYNVYLYGNEGMQYVYKAIKGEELGVTMKVKW